MTYQAENGQPGKHNTTLPTVPDGEGAALAVDSKGRVITSSGDSAADANYFFATITSADAQAATRLTKCFFSKITISSGSG